jgi:hypothetical protein
VRAQKAHVRSASKATIGCQIMVRRFGSVASFQRCAGHVGSTPTTGPAGRRDSFSARANSGNEEAMRGFTASIRVT